MRLTLAEAMKRRGMNPEDLAGQSGVHLATIYRLKRGDISNPSSATVDKLEVALRLKRGTLRFAATPEAMAS